MKRLFTVFLLILSVFTFGKMVEASSTTVEIQVLQGDGLTTGTTLPAEVGSTVSMDTSSFRPTGSTFQFWIVDGSLRHYPEDHTFRIQSSMKLIAVYAASDEHVVIFIDSNGKIIEVGDNPAQYLAQDAKVAKPADPNKPQSTFKGWSLLGSTAEPIQGDIPNATGHAVYLATYEAATGETAQANISVEGGISDKTDDVAGMNEVVEIMPDDSLGTFSYWVDENNQILSKKDFYSFTALGKDRSFRAVYDDQEAISTPIVNLVAYPDLRGGEYVSYVGQYELVEGYDLVEFGIVYEKDGSDVYAKATNYNEETNEFLMSFTKAGKSNFRAYLKYVDANGYVFTEFNSGIITQYATDLIISEYIEGSSNNKFLELYNGTGKPIDLDNVYKLELYSNGKTTVESNLELTGTIANGEVIIVKNASAAEDFYTGDARVIASAVTNFNGDDAIVLKKNGVVIDSFGQVGVDPGSAWTDGGVSTLDKTLVRKPTVLSGRTDSTSTFDPSLEWIQYPVDTAEHLGSHIMTFGVTSSKYDLAKVNQAVIGLPVFEESYSTETTVILPKYNENGAIITWEFQDATDSNNSYMNLETGVITIPETGSNVIKIKATVQVGTTAEEKLYEFSVLGRLTIDEVRSKTDNTSVKFMGIVTGFYGKTVFIEDASGAIQLYYETTLDSNIGVGNEVIIQGTVGVYYGMIQVSNITATTLVSSDNTLSTPVDIDGILTITADYQARRINLIGLTVKAKTAATLTLTDGTNELKIVATATDVKDKLSSAAINEVVNINGMHVEWDSSGRKLRALHVDEITLLGVPDSYYAQEAIDSLIIPDTTTIDLTLPITHTNGSSISWTSDKPTVISNTGVVTRQAQDEVVTLTATVTKGTATLTKEFTVTVLKEGEAVEQIIYETGFESSEGFTTGNVYNNKTLKVDGPEGRKWGTYYGTASTTDAITGNSSLQMRWYSTSDQSANHAYSITQFDLLNVTKIEFKALKTSNVLMKVLISKDGGSTWVGEESFAITTSAADYTYNVSPEYLGGNFRIRFQLTYTTTPSSSSRLTIDDVKVYGNP